MASYLDNALRLPATVDEQVQCDRLLWAAQEAGFNVPFPPEIVDWPSGRVILLSASRSYTVIIEEKKIGFFTLPSVTEKRECVRRILFPYGIVKPNSDEYLVDSCRSVFHEIYPALMA